MRKLVLACLIFFSANCFAQNTTTVPIQGFAMFKLGDTVSLIDSYTYKFEEVFLDSQFDYSATYNMFLHGENFCKKSRVFQSSFGEMDDFDFTYITLSYLNNKLVDIRIQAVISPQDKLVEILKLKYGNGYSKIALDGYKKGLNSYKEKGITVTPEMDKKLLDLYLLGMYWTYGDNIISVGLSNKTYDFVEKTYKGAKDGETGVVVMNKKEFEKLVACSNADYLIRKQEYLNKLKSKTDKY